MIGFSIAYFKSLNKSGHIVVLVLVGIVYT